MSPEGPPQKLVNLIIEQNAFPAKKVLNSSK
jgi:hypothetical protein